MKNPFESVNKYARAKVRKKLIVQAREKDGIQENLSEFCVQLGATLGFFSNKDLMKSQVSKGPKGSITVQNPTIEQPSEQLMNLLNEKMERFEEYLNGLKPEGFDELVKSGNKLFAQSYQYLRESYNGFEKTVKENFAEFGKTEIGASIINFGKRVGGFLSSLTERVPEVIRNAKVETTKVFGQIKNSAEKAVKSFLSPKKGLGIS